MSEKEDPKILDADGAAALLGRLMLAWDGQWFLKVAQSCGLEEAVALNARVRTSFGRIEIREYLKALGLRRAASVEQAARLLDRYGRLFLRDGMQAEWTVNENGVEIAVSRCLPQEGAARAGLKADTPCVACETVWEAWLETALPGTEWTTEVRCAMGRGDRKCQIIVNRK